MSEAHKEKNHYDISASHEMMSAECACEDELMVRKHSL